MTAAFFGFGPPLLLHLLKRRGSPFIREHSRQAVNAAATFFLYTICVIIVGGMLALDSVVVGLVVAGSAETALWLVALLCFFRATIVASGGGFYNFPRWLCAVVLHS
jgi:uncharacterized Tic20 family protein